MTKKLFDEAKKHIPGGVNSPVRAFKAVSGTPLFINKASGSYLSRLCWILGTYDIRACSPRDSQSS